MGSPRQAALAKRPIDKRRYSRLALFSEPTYTTIGDPYTDGRSVAGPPAGVIGSVTCASENKSTFFPPRLCWGVRLPPPPTRPAASAAGSPPCSVSAQGAAPGATTARLPGVSADEWKMQSRSTLPTLGGSQSARSSAHFAPAGPTKTGNIKSVYFSYPKWQQDAYELKEVRESQYRKQQADKIIGGAFYPPDGPRSWVAKKIDTSKEPRRPRVYDPWMQ
jgi:hypothetical protein